MLGGQVDVMFATTAATVEYIKAGKLRALAVTTATRSAALPEVVPVADFVPGYEASFWAGIGAPRGTSAEIIDTLNREINAALVDVKVTSRFDEFGASCSQARPPSSATSSPRTLRNGARW
jgi:tripartite-type tricarboxylate transporter receptor subunit TctC